MEKLKTGSPIAQKMHRRKKWIPQDLGKHIYMWIVLILMLMPLYILLISSVKTSAQVLNDFFVPTFPFVFSNFPKAWEIISPYFTTTFYYAVLNTVLTTLVAVLAGYAFGKLRFPGRKLLFMLLFAKMFLPTVMNLVPSFMLASKLGILNTAWVIVLFCIGQSQPYWVFVMKTFVEQQPKELFESMRLDGASEFRIFTTLVTPLLLPMISLMAINLVLFSWNDFVWPLVTLTEDSKRTITVGLYWLSKSQVGRDYGVLMSGYLLSALPLVVVFMFGMKAFMKGLTAGAIKI